MNIPDYVEDLLTTLPPFIKTELQRLTTEQTTTSNVIQKKYRAKKANNRQHVINLGLVLQLYKDIKAFEEEGTCA